MESHRQSRDVPRCSLPWRRAVHTRKPSVSRRPRMQKREASKHEHLGEKYPDTLGFTRVVTPVPETSRTYSTLARAAGVASPASNVANTYARRDSLPPPVPDKKLKIDTSFLDTKVPQPYAARSASPQTSAGTPYFSSSARAGTPLTPHSATSSFSRSRAGSSAAKAPPPPLSLPAFHRKGSLPSLDLRPPPAHVDHRFRSSSLPQNSLLPVPNMYIKAPQPSNQHSQPAYFQRLFHTATPSEELLQVPESPLATAVSAARASSILSVAQDIYLKRMELVALVREQAAKDQVEIDIRHASSSVVASSPRRSEADSVPHDPIPTPRRDTWQSQHLPAKLQGLVSSNSEKSFDLTSVPFKMAEAPPLPALSSVVKGVGPSTPTSAGIPLSPACRVFTQQTWRTPSVRSARSSKGSLKRRSTLARLAPHAIIPRAAATHTPRRQSTSLAHLLEPEAKPRDFPWNPVKVSQARNICSPRQLQQIILQSMREYGSTQKHALVLDNFEQIPLELEQCNQRTLELEEALKNEISLRESLLKKHVACLKVLNGDQGARFGESLVSAVSKSDRLAQEACQLREHMAKVQHLRDSHWRAAASLSLARLNSSYLKAKDRVKEQDDEIAALKAERDAAMAEIRRLKAPRASTLSNWQSSGGPTPVTSQFDYNTFPTPPQPLPGSLLSPPFSRNNTRTNTRSPPQSPAPETPSSASHYVKAVPSPPPPAASFKELPPLIMPDYRFPPLVSSVEDLSFTAFCSLPTPPVSEVSSSSSPASSTTTSRFRAFTDKVFSTARSQSTPPPDSDLPWARLTDPPLSHMVRSMSTPALDPYADQFSPEVETLRFMPPSMHLSGVMDNEALSLRSSFERQSSAHDSAYHEVRASSMSLDKVDVGTLLAEGRARGIDTSPHRRPTQQRQQRQHQPTYSEPSRGLPINNLLIKSSKTQRSPTKQMFEPVC